jgi:hypothetical protein
MPHWEQLEKILTILGQCQQLGTIHLQLTRGVRNVV